MPGISSPGIGSGLDVKSIVESLVKADITPAKNRLDRREASLTTQLSAIGQVKGSLAKLQSSVTKLADLSQYQALSCSVSNTEILTANISGNGATAANYQVQVQQLAAQQSLASAAFSSSTATLGSGTLTINFGTYSSDNSTFTANPEQPSVTITIAPGQDSLLAIQNAIDSYAAGVQASIIQDNSGTRLTLTSTNTGLNSAMQITVVDNDGNNTDASGLSALAYDPTNSVNSMTQTIAAQDSQVYINGLLLTQSSNELETAIEGVNLNLLSAQPGVTVNLSLTQNTAQIAGMVNDFVKQYNDTLATINSLTGYSPELRKGGLLQSDSSIRSLKSALANLVSQPLDTVEGSYNNLTSIGIKTNLKGMLEMNSTTFNEVLSNNSQAIANLFAKSATATDPYVRVTSVGRDIEAGSYKLVIDEYTPGTTLSGTINGISAVSSDGINLNGTGNFGELSLAILGGNTGVRGNINVTDGLAVLFEDLLSSYLSPQGNLSAKTNQLNSYIKDISEDRDELAMRAMYLSDRYTRQFTALDTLLAQMQATSQFLTRQLDNLVQINNPKK